MSDDTSDNKIISSVEGLCLIIRLLGGLEVKHLEAAKAAVDAELRSRKEMMSLGSSPGQSKSTTLGGAKEKPSPSGPSVQKPKASGTGSASTGNKSGGAGVVQTKTPGTDGKQPQVSEPIRLSEREEDDWKVVRQSLGAARRKLKNWLVAIDAGEVHKNTDVPAFLDLETLPEADVNDFKSRVRTLEDQIASQAATVASYVEKRDELGRRAKAARKKERQVAHDRLTEQRKAAAVSGRNKKTASKAGNR
jgi:hypothetical protein